MDYAEIREADRDRLREALPETPAALRTLPQLRPEVVDAILGSRRRPLLWIASDRREAHSLVSRGARLWEPSDERLHHAGPGRLERARTLSSVREPGITVSLPDSLTGSISPQRWEQLRIRVRTGEEHSQDHLLAGLAEAGYERGSGPATLERSGDTLRVTDITGRELRLEWFGDVIERLSRDERELPELVIDPLVSEGDSSLGAFFTETVSSHPDHTGNLVTFTADGEDLGSRRAPIFYRHRSRLESYLRTQLGRGYTITVEGLDPDLTALARALDLPHREKPTDAGGWVWEATRRIHLTDYEYDPRPTKSAEIIPERLTGGEVVVHRDYGLARFHQLVDREIDGLSRSYLQLEFAGTDRLYLPVESRDRLYPYGGSDEPSLSSLGGGDWQATLGRVRRASQDIALELLGRYAERELATGYAAGPTPGEDGFAARFPYQLTDAQRRVVSEVLSDMAAPRPMDRLVAGDVGFGKTEIAWRAAYRTLSHGQQVALIAPTTILVEQHLASARARFEGEAVSVEGLSRFKTPSQQRSIIEGLGRGGVDLVIGTHRLLGRDVSFRDLGLVIIDEEQRFGVEDKERLRRLYEHVDVLSLSATPIPRTLELALGEIRPMSLIEEGPSGRLSVETSVIPAEEAHVRTAIERELERDGQVYVITPRISRIPRLREEIRRLFPDVPTAVAHGRLPERELSEIMGRFTAGEIRILIASTIVENGLDLAAANTMLIDDPGRFGLSELYQLRGRIGRRDRQAYCYLIRGSERFAPETEERIRSFVDSSRSGGGIDVAMRDLELRGSGNILGREQHGYLMGVGLTLYSKLLEEAKSELRAGRKLQLETALIDLPLETTLPPEVAGSLEERLQIYRRVESIADLQALSQLERDLESEHGRVEALHNLTTIRRLKLVSLGTPVAGVRRLTRPRPQGGRRDYLALTLIREPSASEISALEGLRRGWTHKGIELRAPLDLGPEPPAHLALEAIEALATADLTAPRSDPDTARQP